MRSVKSIKSKNVILLLLTAVTLFSMINLSSARECFQETANVSTSCGGLSTGYYGPFGDSAKDGNYATFTNTVAAGWYVNYTIPNLATSAKWQGVYDIGEAAGVNYTNFTIPHDCFNKSNTFLNLHIWIAANQ